MMAKGMKKGKVVGDGQPVWPFEDCPIGMLPDGTLNIVKLDDPPFRPQLVDVNGHPLDDITPGAAQKAAYG